MTPDLERRLRQVRSRVAVRAWAYRQRHHAKGMWMRLRRVLAEAQAAYAISAGEAEQLLAEGYEPHPVGRELEPPKVIIFVSTERASRIPGAEAIPLHLDARLLETSALALVAFP